MISRRDFIKAAGAAAVTFTIPGCLTTGNNPEPETPPKKPNIVFLLADDLGWGDVGYHGGSIQTANIDALASSGAKLEQFYVQPLCSPTRAAFLTGRYPIRYGLQVGVVRPWADYGLSLQERTLAEALKQAGYVTAICGKWHLGHLSPEYLPTRRGFDHQYGHYNGMIDYFAHSREGSLDWNQNDKLLVEEGYTTDLIADESVRLIETHDLARPLFLYVPFNAPHYPLQAPQKFVDLYSHIENIKERKYAAMVTCMDQAIGKIIKALEKRGMTSNTLIFFCSDNGGTRYSGDNTPLRDYKGSIYEGGTRVLAIAAWPGTLKAGVTVEEPLHIVDMYPTLLKLAGASLTQPLPIDGKDIWPAIAEGKSSPHNEILFNCTPFNGAIRRGNWKLVRNGHFGAGYAGPIPGKDIYELFDLAEDPSEQNNLAEKFPRKFNELKQRLDYYTAQAVKPSISPDKMPSDFKVPKYWGHPD